MSQENQPPAQPDQPASPSALPPKEVVSTQPFQSATKKKWPLILILVLILIGIGAAGYFLIQKQIRQKPQVAGPVATPEPIPEISQTTPEPASAFKKDAEIYSVKLRLKADDVYPPAETYRSLEEYLPVLLGFLPAPGPESPIDRIVFDTRESEPFLGQANTYNSNYYVMLDSTTLETPKILEDDYVRAEIQKIDFSLAPYLKDPLYCEKDEDCLIRTDFCTEGAYNAYHRYTTFGCGTDPENAVPTPVPYLGTQCVQNKCAGLLP